MPVIKTEVAAGVDHAPQISSNKAVEPCQEHQDVMLDQELQVQQDGIPEHALSCAPVVSNSNAAHGVRQHSSLVTDQQELRPQQLQLPGLAIAASHKHEPQQLQLSGSAIAASQEQQPQHLQLPDSADAAFQISVLEQLVGKALACATYSQHLLPANLQQRLRMQESQRAKSLGPCSPQQPAAHAQCQSEHSARCAVMLQSTQQVIVMVCTEAGAQQHHQSIGGAPSKQHEQLVQSSLLQLQGLPASSIVKMLTQSAGTAPYVCMPGVQDLFDAPVRAEISHTSSRQADIAMQPAPISSVSSVDFPGYEAAAAPSVPFQPSSGSDQTLSLVYQHPSHSGVPLSLSSQHSPDQQFTTALEQSQAVDLKANDASQHTDPVHLAGFLATELHDGGCVALACLHESGMPNALTLNFASPGTSMNAGLHRKACQ